MLIFLVMLPIMCCDAMVSGQESHPAKSEQRGTRTPQLAVRNTHPGRDTHTNKSVSAHKQKNPIVTVTVCVCVCVAVFAPCPWQHSRKGNAAWVTAHPRRNTDPVGRRDCQNRSHREGPRHTTGKSNTPSLKFKKKAVHRGSSTLA